MARSDDLARAVIKTGARDWSGGGRGEPYLEGKPVASDSTHLRLLPSGRGGRCSAMRIPRGLQEKGSWGPEVREWLDALPGLCADLSDRWSVRLGEPFANCQVTLVVPAEGAEIRAVIKIPFPPRSRSVPWPGTTVIAKPPRSGPGWATGRPSSWRMIRRRARCWSSGVF